MQGCGAIWGKSFAGQGKSTFKGPEAGGEELHGQAGGKRRSWLCLGSSIKLSVPALKAPTV